MPLKTNSLPVSTVTSFSRCEYSERSESLSFRQAAGVGLLKLVLARVSRGPGGHATTRPRVFGWLRRFDGFEVFGIDGSFATESRLAD